jgi:ribosomal protein S18 acetylase RimI-like enzyme
MTKLGAQGVEAVGQMVRTLTGGRRSPLGRRVRDRLGRPVDVGDFDPQHWTGVLAMYRAMSRGRRGHGLPPVPEDQLAYWVGRLWRRGPNLVARIGGWIVGHAALIPDGVDSLELVVFVHPECQGAGIGSALVSAILALGGRRGADRVWSSVEAHNEPAIALFERAGFHRLTTARLADRDAREVWVLPDRPAGGERPAPVGDVAAHSIGLTVDR